MAGEVPEQWDIWKISHGFRRIGSGTTPASNDMSFYEGDIPWVTTSELRENIHSVKLDLELFKYITTFFYYICFAPS
jgi:restriction endonuclease S subunit